MNGDRIIVTNAAVQPDAPDGRAAREADPAAESARAPGPKVRRPRLPGDARCVIRGLDPEVARRMNEPDRREFSVRIRIAPPGPIIYPPSSREIARRKAKAEEAARNAEAARQLRALVQRGLKPPSGKAFAVDVGARLLIGPNGAVGSSERITRTLEPLAAGGRHAAAVLMVAGGWADDAALREALAGIGGKLAAVGLRIDRRKAGIRMAKIPPPGPTGAVSAPRCT